MNDRDATPLGAALMLLVMAGILTVIFGGIGGSIYLIYKLLT